MLQEMCYFSCSQLNLEQTDSLAEVHILVTVALALIFHNFASKQTFLMSLALNYLDLGYFTNISSVV